MVRLILIAILLFSVSPADAQRRDGGRYDRHHRHPDHQRWDRHRPQEQGGGIGDFIGGVIGGIIRGQQPDPVDECIRRFRSYNPETGYYRLYSGEYRRCP